MEYDQTGNITAKYTHGPNIDEPLAVQQRTNTYYYHADGLGSITALSNSSGNIVQTYSYDSFGNMTATGNIRQPYAFTGREYDAETSMYFYRARYYDPKVGRFVTKDPIGFAGGINVYAYVENNPVRFKDPKGKNVVVHVVTHFIVEPLFRDQHRLNEGAKTEKNFLKDQFEKELERCKNECLKDRPTICNSDEDKKTDQCLNNCVDEYYRKMNDLDRWDVYE
jgi:RHS repeat-associated protein